MREIGILVIDLQYSWRDRFTRMLRDAGFAVHSFVDYNLSMLQHTLQENSPDLTLLGCVSVGEEEQAILRLLLEQNYHVLVVCTNPSLQEMRSLFLQGVDDVVDKTYDSASFIDIVRHVVEKNIAPRKDSMAVERKGTVWFGRGVF